MQQRLKQPVLAAWHRSLSCRACSWKISNQEGTLSNCPRTLSLKQRLRWSPYDMLLNGMNNWRSQQCTCSLLHSLSDETDWWIYDGVYSERRLTTETGGVGVNGNRGGFFGWQAFWQQWLREEKKGEESVEAQNGRGKTAKCAKISRGFIWSSMSRREGKTRRRVMQDVDLVDRGSVMGGGEVDGAAGVTAGYRVVWRK